MTTILRRISVDDLHRLDRRAFDAETLAAAARIVDDVRSGGDTALRAYAERFGDVAPGQSMTVDAEAMAAAAASLPAEVRALLQRTADRIRAFAEAQRACLSDLSMNVPGGFAGHRVQPVPVAGCYAPGGRYPLPSSMLMTVIPAKVAGVTIVWAASPKPTPVTLAAAAIAGATGLMRVGGAHAIAALVYGIGGAPRCDIIVGPGNRWVTAAKYIVSRDVAIDMLAGPSELVVLADDSAEPALVAADLLAQAEHDPAALPILVAMSRGTVDGVDAELARQLRDLPTAETARAALGNGFAVLVANKEQAVYACDVLAPEHLHVHTSDAERIAPRFSAYGALFIGGHTPEVLGDYGIGPNHVLPTGGAARSFSGLSVRDFLRWGRSVAAPAKAARRLAPEAAVLARFEGLVAHASALDRRVR